MKKPLYTLLIGLLALGTSMVLAKTGVIVHQNDGTSVFFPSEDVESIEFVEDYTTDVPEGPSDGQENPGDNGDNNGGNTDPGTDKDDNVTPAPGNPGTGTDTPSEPDKGEQGTPENPSDKEENPSGGTTDKPDEPSNPDNGNGTGSGNNSGNQNPGNNDGDQTDKPSPENPDKGDQQPENPDQGDQNEPSEPETPEDPSEPTEPEKPQDLTFHLFIENGLPLDHNYLIVANGKCATPVATSNEYGYLPSQTVSISNNTISDNLNNAYSFTTTCTVNGTEYSAPSGKFLIKDTNNRYLYLKDSYTSFNLSATPEVASNKIADAYLFIATKNSDGTWKISNTRNGDTKYLSYSSKYDNFAAYSSLSTNDSYPQLYIQGSDYTVPDNNAGNSGEGSGSGDSGNTGQLDPVTPDNYKYPLSYVVLPDNTPQQVKEYTSYTLNYNKDNHTANYVAWELLASETSGSVDRKKYSYWVDKDIEGCLSTDFGYSTYKYERGHMCPAADNKWSGEAMKDCMSMANMVPQLSTLNGAIWGTLEDKSRTWANRDGALWIISGPIYSDSDNLYVGGAKARVPHACFKAILYNGSKPRAIAFVFQNGSNPGNLQDYAMSIDELEKLTGYDFFSALPDEIENAIEASFNFSDWN